MADSYLFSCKPKAVKALQEKKQTLHLNKRNPYLCQPLKKSKT